MPFNEKYPNHKQNGNLLLYFAVQHVFGKDLLCEISSLSIINFVQFTYGDISLKLIAAVDITAGNSVKASNSLRRDDVAPFPINHRNFELIRSK